MSTHDVAIIGAGVGGACAAIALAKRGARVLLLEAGDFPRHKVCGEFLSPESHAVFQRIGVLDTIVAAGAREIARAQIIAPDGSTLVTPLPAPGLSISRFCLDESLWQKAENTGVRGLSNRRVKSVRQANDGYIVHTHNQSFETRAVIDATGRARLTTHAAPGLKTATRFLGLKAHFNCAQIETDLVELHFWRGGYCGLVRVEGDVCNVCLLVRYDRCDSSNNVPQRVWQKVLTSCPALTARLKNARQITPWQATANVQFAARAAADETGILRIGDAAGYIHPLTGDGMAMAARGGELAAAVCGAALRGSLSTHDTSALYQAAWRREFESRLKWGDVLGTFLLSPIAATAMSRVLKYRPRQIQFLIRKTRGALL